MLKAAVVTLATVANLVLAGVIGYTFFLEFGGVPGRAGGGFYFVLAFIALQLQLFVIVAVSETERNTFA